MDYKDDPRASWWREIREGEIVPAGCPVRVEIIRGDGNQTAAEHVFIVNWSIDQDKRGVRAYVDSRWLDTPEPEPLAVGDVLETMKGLERFSELPLSAYMTDRDGKGWSPNKGWFDLFTPHMGGQNIPDAIGFAPFTIRYIPEED